MQLLGITMMFLDLSENYGKRLMVITRKEIKIFRKITHFLKNLISHLYYRKLTPLQMYFIKDKKQSTSKYLKIDTNLRLNQ